MSGMMLQAFGEKGIHAIYPPPAGMDFHDKAALTAYVAQIPSQEFLLLLANYGVCSLIAGIVASMISGRNIMLPALIVGSIITLGEVFNVMMLPGQPVWFSAASLLIHLPFALVGYAVVRKRELGIGD